MGMEPQGSTSKQEQTVATERLEPAAGSYVATRPPPTNRRRALLMAAGAFAVTILVVAGVALLSSDDEPVPFGAESSLVVADDYFAAFNAGDSEAVMALFTPDATFALQFTGDRTAEPMLRADWEERLVWNAAQGTIMTTHDCAVTNEAPGAVTVECEQGTHDAPAQAVDAVAVPNTTTMKITPDGIGEFHELYGRPDFGFVGEPFDAWMTENHPDDVLAAGFGNWSSLEEANEHGRIRAQYADEWAADLEATGCTFSAEPVRIGSATLQINC
jgi:ketosteroid isomerase-like protein